MAHYPLFCELVRKHGKPQSPRQPTQSFMDTLHALVLLGSAQAKVIHVKAGVTQPTAWHILRRFERYGLAERSEGPSETNNGVPSVTYKITDLGLQLDAELQGAL